MDRSRLIAGIVGPTITAVGASLLINRGLLDQLMLSLAGHPEAILLVGVGTLVAGLLIVTNHNVWRGWPIVLTLFGWNAVFAGLYRVLLPGQLATMLPTLVAQGWVFPVATSLFLVVGLFLSWKAFSA